MLSTNNLLKISLFLYPILAWFLWDILIYSTVAANLVVYLFIWLKRPINSLIKNGLLIFMGASIWFYYGRFIDPEIGVNFLLGVVPLKFVEQSAPRDRLILFFGMILLLGVGMLFEKTLFYFGFVLLGLGFLFWGLYRDRKSPFKLKNLGIYLGLTAPLTILLFLVFPRALSPFFYRPSPPSQGEVGYTTDVRLNEIEQLSYSSRVVFQAQLNQELPSEKLYWRGNTISMTDGWNWNSDYRDRFVSKPGTPRPNSGVKQIIKSETTEEFMFALDQPHTYVWAGAPYSVDQVNLSRPQGRYTRISNYTAYSDLKNSYETEALRDLDQKNYLYLPKMKRGFRERVLRLFKAESPKFLIQKIRDHLRNQNFQYSLAPGRVESFDDFWYNKKIGFCSHFSSAIGIILRIHNIPTRLVSGFLGGDYNPYTGIYKVSQNDAHVWVEAYFDNKWHRIDPVAWIAPDRVALGGDGYVQQVLVSRARPWMNYFTGFKDAQQWVEQWNVKFYSLVENYDRVSQIELANSFELDLKQFYSILPLGILLVGLVTYFWQRPFWRRRPRSHFIKASEVLMAKLKDLGRQDSQFEFRDFYIFIDGLNIQNKAQLKDLVIQFEMMAFRDEDYTQIDEWIKKLKAI